MAGSQAEGPRRRLRARAHGLLADGLQAMELTDKFGQTTVLKFSKLERNRKVNPDEFSFDPPKGADVLGE